MPRNSKMYSFLIDYRHFKQEYDEPTVVVKDAIKKICFYQSD